MSLKKIIDQFWEQEAQPALMDFIRIPAKSTAFDSQWEKHGFLLQCCELGQRWISKVLPQAQTEIIKQEGKTPCLLVDIPSNAVSNTESIVFYGHLDKQPEAGGWRKGLSAWSPVIENGKLFGRGAADDGYSLFSMITSVFALEKLGLTHPRIIGIFETQEESGSIDLPYYLEQLKDRLGEPKFFIVLDNHCGDYYPGLAVCRPGFRLRFGKRHFRAGNQLPLRSGPCHPGGDYGGKWPWREERYSL